MILKFRDRETAFLHLMYVIKTVLSQNIHQRQYLVCFDIDDTVISESDAIVCGQMFFHYVAKLPNVHLIFVTARKAKSRVRTRQILSQFGMDDYEHLFMFPDHIKRTPSSISTFKTKAMCEACIVHDYRLISMIGNAWLDLIPQTLEHEITTCKNQEGNQGDLCSFMITGQLPIRLKLGKLYGQYVYCQ